MHQSRTCVRHPTQHSRALSPTLNAGTCRLDRLTDKRVLPAMSTDSRKSQAPRCGLDGCTSQRRRRTSSESASAAATCWQAEFCNLTSHQPHGLPTEFTALPSRPHLLASERFHALFHSLFKVLFNFPSLYLFAIGLVVIFSLRWRLPPTSPCTRKQGDSLVVLYSHRLPAIRGLHPPWHGASLRRTYASQPHELEPPSRYSSECRCRPSDSALGSSHFTRSYYGNPRWFLFLRLVICLSSAGNLV